MPRAATNLIRNHRARISATRFRVKTSHKTSDTREANDEQKVALRYLIFYCADFSFREFRATACANSRPERCDLRKRYRRHDGPVPGERAGGMLSCIFIVGHCAADQPHRMHRVERAGYAVAESHTNAADLRGRRRPRDHRKSKRVVVGDYRQRRQRFRRHSTRRSGRYDSVGSHHKQRHNFLERELRDACVWLGWPGQVERHCRVAKSNAHDPHQLRRQLPIQRPTHRKSLPPSRPFRPRREAAPPASADAAAW